MPKNKLTKEISKYQPPAPEIGDKLHHGAKGVLSLLPAASELFEFFVQPPIEKRLNKWREEVAQALHYLEQNRAVNLEELQGNEHFVTIVVQATAIAAKNHQQEKLIALKNAILNAGSSSEFEEDLELIFIRFIEELTPTHLRLLKFFSKNQSNIVSCKSYPDVYKLYSSQEEHVATQDEFKMLIGDLHVHGLLWISQDIEDFSEIYQAGALMLVGPNDNLPRFIVTEVAKKFLEFISFSDGVKV